ncbi:hypothetical protein B0H14DRAFT_814126 [Mycena olivaceomarginata]|nr:hypothetical protein B0H14DRAFT_814126 [Mycena olivaceomarginata]
MAPKDSHSRGLFSEAAQTGGGKQRSGETPALENAIISDASPIPQVFHPSQIIHEHIRREVPEAAVVITHDDDWRDVFREDAAGKNRSELQQAIFDRFEITEEEGAVFLRTKVESRELKTEAMSSTPEVDMGDKPPPKETENRLDVSSAEELIASIGPLQGASSPNEKHILQGISAQKHDGHSFQAEEESIKRDGTSPISPVKETPPKHGSSRGRTRLQGVTSTHSQGPV